MAVADSLLKEVLALAKGLKALRPDQLAHILEFAPKMGEEDLMKVKASLEKVQAAQKKDLAAKTEVLKSAAAAHQGWEADKARTALKAEESTENQSAQASAEQLLSTLN